jgi:opacity protein-like surface antigen
VDPTLGPVSASVKTDLQTVGVGANAMLRAQFIKDADVPTGRLQPYVFGGPTVFISTLNVKGQGSAVGTTVTVDQSDTSTKLGFTAGAGVTYLFTNYIGAFAEYRFTHFKPEFEGSQSNVSVKVEPQLDTHHLIAGVAFRF